MANTSDPSSPPSSFDTNVTSASLPKHTPTNKEILSNHTLFHVHITEIDRNINYSPNTNPMQLAKSHPRALEITSIYEPSKSTTPRKDITTSVGTQDLTSNTPEPHISDLHLATNTNPSCNTESLVDLKIGTWCRFGPSAHVMDISEKTEQVLGPKRKCEDTKPYIAILTDKKQKRLDDETMSIISWNYQGFGNPRTINALKRALKKKAPICVFLMELKLTTEQLNGMKQN